MPNYSLAGENLLLTIAIFENMLLDLTVKEIVAGAAYYVQLLHLKLSALWYRTHVHCVLFIILYISFSCVSFAKCMWMYRVNLTLPICGGYVIFLLCVEIYLILN